MSSVTGSHFTEDKEEDGGFFPYYGSLLDEAPSKSLDDTQSENVTSSHADYMSPIRIAAILSTAFTYGCIMSTLFLLTLPIECQRIESESNAYHPYTVKKSIALGGFAFIAGITQLITPVLGMISDNYKPPAQFVHMQYLGKRLPYLILGIFVITLGLLGQLYSSKPIHKIKIIPDPNDEYLTQTAILGGTWIPYTIFYTFSMIGLNVVYTVMIAFIPDYVPHSQTGLSNGTLALLMVTGSLFGFGSFHLLLDDNIMAMYKLYIVVTMVSGLLTVIFVMDRERELHRHSWTVGTFYKDLQSTSGTDDRLEVIRRFPSIGDSMYILFIQPLQEKTKKDVMAAYWIDISHHRDFFYVTISRFFYYMGISSQTFFLYFIHDEIQDDIETPRATVALLAIAGQCAGALTCLPVGIISDKYFGGHRKIFVYISCICLGMANVLLLFCNHLVHMILVCVLLGAANGVYLTMDTSLAVDTLEVGEDNDEQRSSCEMEDKKSDVHAAQLLGVWGVFGFVGSASGPLIGGLALLVFGRDADSNKFYSARGYTYLFVLSAFYFLCSAFTLTFVKKKGV
jgi:hypothetical protein